MPFDGVEFNQVTQQLKDAKELLIKEGWCTGARINHLGEHCALGVLDEIRGNKWLDEKSCPTIKRLADTIPKDFMCLDIRGAPYTVAAYNNSQTDIKPILEWFDRAIG